MAERRAIPESTQTALLQRSGRRCCICVGLSGDVSEKQGQIAHLDQDPGNSDITNLVFLCLAHHDQYDSKTSQSKGFTLDEVKKYRDDLYVNLDSIIRGNRRAGDVSVSANVSAGNGLHAPGGNASIEGGTGYRGASGGNVNIGAGNYKGGDGLGAPGGTLTIKGGDAK